MASTSSSTVYVGNLAAHLDESALAEAFAPFGDIVSVSLPTSAPSGSAQRRNKGFGFVTFSSPDDALDALDNMHLNALTGRTIHVKLADKEQPKQASNRAVWTDEEWLKQYGGAESTEQETETKDEAAT
ncbi:RNA-binding domain-containing protein [Moesziomyces antarcticus]|uniref:Related to ribonucleoprotein n=2 Tax=Pseudozyma antarctica TaxID=84753 RepID=A0A5C3FND2_PSEA2|nr:RNA-binding domain-containing protein [Moesziomyces antarcticus]GAK64752.1 RNA-binding domain-containing protein [Moesziomyces antarcticus]SPO45740.1 related to ribonucleoprotein [Moesziomyces antarcticus]